MKIFAIFCVGAFDKRKLLLFAGQLNARVSRTAADWPPDSATEGFRRRPL